MTLLLQKAKATGQGGLVQYQDFANAVDRHGLEFGYGGQDSELGGPDARRLEGEVEEAGYGASGATEVKGSAGTGTVEVEGLG
jgi:hypothetical protein